MSFDSRCSCHSDGSEFGAGIFSGRSSRGVPTMEICRNSRNLDGILPLSPFSNSHARHAGRVGRGKLMRKASDPNMLRELIYLDEGRESPIGPFEIVTGPDERRVCIWRIRAFSCRREDNSGAGSGKRRG